VTCRKEDNGAFARGIRLKQIDAMRLEALTQEARQSPRLRANLNLHEDLADPVQRLAIAMEPGTVVRPHRHPHTWELLYPLRGRFIVLHFDDQGRVTGRVLLGEECHMLENPANTWHGVLSLDDGGVIFEVKHGPYTPIAPADFAPWGGHGDGEEGAALLAWYARARVGDVLPERLL
jgi:cupin fold WbuC family metalloprotein